MPCQIIPIIAHDQHNVSMIRHANHLDLTILTPHPGEIRPAIRIEDVGMTVLSHFHNHVAYHRQRQSTMPSPATTKSTAAECDPTTLNGQVLELF